MNLRDLEYFVLVAELKHFGKAAEKVFVSQPTLSMQIKKLEEYLGVSLFERTNRQVRLTQAGELLYRQAKSIVVAAKNFQETAKTYRDPFESSIKLGVIPTIAPYFLPKLLPLLHKHFPKLKVEVSEIKTENIVKALHEHELDLGLLALPVSEPALESISLFDEAFLLALPEAYNRKDIKSLDDVKDQNLLLLEEGHCLRDQALAFCQEKGVKVPADVRATSLETLRALIANNMGYSLMPEMAAFPSKGICYKKLKSAPTRHIGFIFRHTAPQIPLFKAIAEKILKG
ncbi:MAG: transcriptional regulator [Gammaproteobacteria bacterium]|jgi:LysR family hydrogen peroxide-inducible transcriptional activator|nr:transcriptional regulator [Gammaproteobacteria bacterium]